MDAEEEWRMCWWIRQTARIIILWCLIGCFPVRFIHAYPHTGGQSHQQPAEYRYLSNPGATCGEDVFLLAVVCSGVDHFEQRAAIRATWATAAHNRTAQVKVVFMLGTLTQLASNASSHLAKEQRQHRDIIQEDFVDSYANLSLKTMRALNWIEKHCSKAVFVLKTDDDVFINIPVLLRDLHNTVHTRFIMGVTIAGAQPIRDKNSKWFTPPEQYNRTMYPTYVSGSAYVISGDAISDLYRAAATEENMFWLEDIFITGFCAKNADLKHIYNGKFGYKRRLLSPCLFKLIITSHRVTPGEMIRVWREIQRGDLVCDYLRLHLDIVT